MNYEDRLKEVQLKTKGMTDVERIDLMLNEIDVEYDGFIDEHREHMRKESIRGAIYAIIIVVGIIAFTWAGFHFDLYTVS